MNTLLSKKAPWLVVAGGLALGMAYGWLNDTSASAQGDPAPAKTAAPAAAQEIPSVTLPPELDRVLRDYEKAWKAGDTTALANLFSEDGFVLGNGKPPVRGRDKIRTAYDNPSGELRLRALAFATEETIGWIVGAFSYGPSKGDMGKFVLALQRDSDEGATWQIAADMDNTNRR